MRTERVNALLATSLTDDDIAGLLTPIGFAKADGVFTVPSWRPDCRREIDLVEEVARHYGYDKIGQAMPSSSTPGGLSARQRDRRALRQLLLGLGLNEALPNPWLAPGDVDRAGIASLGEPIVIGNPMAAEESVLRTSLLPRSLEDHCVQRNSSRPGCAVL